MFLLQALQQDEKARTLDVPLFEGSIAHSIVTSQLKLVSQREAASCDHQDHKLQNCSLIGKLHAQAASEPMQALTRPDQLVHAGKLVPGLLRHAEDGLATRHVNNASTYIHAAERAPCAAIAIAPSKPSFTVDMALARCDLLVSLLMYHRSSIDAARQMNACVEIASD